MAPFALYSTGKCENGAHLLSIGRYMCKGISILTYTGTRKNVRETNVRVDKCQSDKHQRIQTSECQTSEKTNIRVGKCQRNFVFCQTLTFCLNFKKIPLLALTMVRFSICDHDFITNKINDLFIVFKQLFKVKSAKNCT
jgi:hypothetical protein